MVFSPLSLVGTKLPDDPLRGNFSRRIPTRDSSYFLSLALLRIEHSCNCSTTAFYGGFYFSFDQLTAYLLIFFNWCDEVGLFFFFFVL